ncbi:DNA alkylation repair protein [Streptomyces chattanoogensis]|uniref:DNA alkylation repair protein n=1 Tax=Streptomyces chattanoogensis TaxID=66876 RepID=UPI0036A197EA
MRRAGHQACFIRTAIGWALRAYATTDPVAVRESVGRAAARRPAGRPPVHRQGHRKDLGRASEGLRMGFGKTSEGLRKDFGKASEGPRKSLPPHINHSTPRPAPGTI